MSLHDQIKLTELPAAIDHRLNDFAIACVFPDREARIDTARQLKKSIEAYARHAAAELAIASDARIKELEAALSEARKELESWAFESWLERTRPSGDVEEVQRQWEKSDFMTRNALKGQP